jgi:hypothetical protein
MTTYGVAARELAARVRVVAPLALLVSAVLGVTGCIGGAQPVPPAIDPVPRADAGREPTGDAGTAAFDAGSPNPPPEVDLTGFEDSVRGGAPPFAPRPSWPSGWRPGDFGAPSGASDAGTPSPAPASEGVDGPDGA